MSTGNILLDRMPASVLTRLGPSLESVTLRTHDVIHRPGEAIRSLYFPVTCMISITVTMCSGSTIETGAVGSREVAGINAFMGGRETTQTEYIVQLPGEAIRISAEPLKVEFDRNTEFRAILLKYTQAMIAQISQNVACNRLHHIETRCARWLLEVRDRVREDRFLLTQEFIAEMLGASRVSVSQAMAELKAASIIDYSRGYVGLRDIPALEKRSCECYFVLRDEYDRLLGLPQRLAA
ncbi:MAG: Crp/Fnr family transcriptional regulator [Pyrinomonadaceae bacterium]